VFIICIFSIILNN